MKPLKITSDTAFATTQTMTRSIAMAITMALGLAGCSPKSPADAPTASSAAQGATPAESLDQVVAKGQGFTVGAMMSTQTAYVMFDPQCPHCGQLWEASKPLWNKVKFVWVPVAIMNAKSATQGAALLTATDPAQAMNAHEVSILAGTGGMAASADVPGVTAKSIKANTELFNQLKLSSVPYIVAKNSRTGEVITQNGSMPTGPLAKLLGVEPP